MYFRQKEKVSPKVCIQLVAHLEGAGGVSVSWQLLLWWGKTSGPLSSVHRAGCTLCTVFRWLMLPELSNYAMLYYGCAAAKTTDFERHFGPLKVFRFKIFFFPGGDWPFMSRECQKKLGSYHSKSCFLGLKRLFWRPKNGFLSDKTPIFWYSLLIKQKKNFRFWQL